MRVVAISDLHGHLPTKLPSGDILIVAGDICPTSDHSPPYQLAWLERSFLPWLRWKPFKHKVFIAGNHDFAFQLHRFHVPTDLCRFYLQDNEMNLGGLRVYGTPWQPVFHDWAFNATEGELEKIWAKIPDGIDILVVHGPPRGAGDLTLEGIRTGSPSLHKRIFEVRPKLVVTGHIHEDAGLHFIQDIPVINASYLDRAYQPTNPVQVFELT